MRTFTIKFSNPVWDFPSQIFVVVQVNDRLDDLEMLSENLSDYNV